MEVVDGFVHVFVGAVGVFNFEGVQCFGVDDAFDVLAGVDDGEISEAGFEELVEGEGAEDVGAFDKEHFGFWNHEFVDFAFVEAHNGGDAVAVFAVDNGFRSTLKYTDEIFE